VCARADVHERRAVRATRTVIEAAREVELSGLKRHAL
jgi:hypothetical protein